jgi:hypothetical protein
MSLPGSPAPVPVPGGAESRRSGSLIFRLDTGAGTTVLSPDVLSAAPLRPQYATLNGAGFSCRIRAVHSELDSWQLAAGSWQLDAHFLSRKGGVPMHPQPVWSNITPASSPVSSEPARWSITTRSSSTSPGTESCSGPYEAAVG